MQEFRIQISSVTARSHVAFVTEFRPGDVTGTLRCSQTVQKTLILTSPSLLAHSRIGELHCICIFPIPLTFSGKNAGEGYQASAVLSVCFHYLPSIKGLVILTGTCSP